MMANKGIGAGNCPNHGEYYLDAEDSPCPSCEDGVEAANLPKTTQTLRTKIMQRTCVSTTKELTFHEQLSGGVNTPLTSFHRLLYTRSGAARLTSVIGFIEGLHAAGKQKEAQTLYESLYRQLGYLNSWGGFGELGGKQIPLSKIVLTDDCSLHSFGVTFYTTNTDPKVQKKWKDSDMLLSNRYQAHELDHCSRFESLHFKDGIQWINKWPEQTIYLDFHYAMNGGLIYHGPKTFNKDNQELNHLWSVHT